MYSGRLRRKVRQTLVLHRNQTKSRNEKLGYTPDILQNLNMPHFTFFHMDEVIVLLHVDISKPYYCTKSLE